MITLNEQQVKNVAKQIALLAKENGAELKHTSILDSIAKGLDFTSFNVLKPKLQGLIDSKDASKISPSPKLFIPSPDHSKNEDLFDRCVSNALGAGFELLDSQNVMQWLIETIGCGLNVMSDPCYWDGVGSEFMQHSHKELKRWVFKRCIFDIAISLINLQESKKKDTFDSNLIFEYVDTINGDNHMQKLIDSGDIFDDKLLALMMTDKSDFEEAYQMARNSFKKNELIA